MNISEAYQCIVSLIGKRVSVKVNVGRNKFEKFEGVVERVYPSLFTIYSNNLVKSYSYSDVVTKTIVIKCVK